MVGEMAAKSADDNKIKKSKKITICKMKIYQFIIVAVVAVSVLYIVCGSQYRNTQRGVVQTKFIGYYSADDRKALDITGQSKLNTVKTTSMQLCGTIVSDAPFSSKKSSETLHARLSDAAVKVSQNGNLIYEKDFRESTTGLVFNSCWVDFELHQPYNNIKIELICDGTYAGKAADLFLTSLCAGSERELLDTNLRQHLIQIIFGFLMLGFGLALTLTVVALEIIRAGSFGSFIPCGLLLICGALCTLIDYDYISLLISNQSLLNLIDYMSQVLICLFLMMYFQTFIEGKKGQLMINGMLALTVLTIPACLILHYLGLISMKLFVAVQLPVLTSLMMFSVLVIAVQFCRSHKKKIQKLLKSAVVLTAFTIAEMLRFYIVGEYWIVLFQMGLFVFAVIQFFCLIESAGETIRQAELAEYSQRELDKIQIQLMLSQIQPHFLYNALCVIQDLCHGRAPEAEQATIEFAKFLRGNLDSLSIDRPISIEQELEHTRNYLALEQKRFGDRLKVVYDIEEIEFQIPTLTIQPIVENAVRYGIMKRETGGTIWILVKAEAEGHVITIKDDGIGFDIFAEKEDGKQHVGIRNVRSRLAKMCGGTMELASVPGEGTTVWMRIPYGDT